ncbi:tetratricopeptide repeat protein [Fusobacterium animalis 11_3_2]|uniref:Tetratricopeptide repeat protein n=1 Tax=Fusobacterium animalis 11_3_2 TaxID=457403 RepID=F7L0V5_9FUSO|nr:DnaJ domain-containing protein [Fusobacterium animalis]EGN66797.1 tetratricopeptide repeat protein [Fusobacterium animalis 11_3_2]
MEVMLIPLLILFFILVAGFGIENTFKILPPLIILGLLIYFLGWVAVRYFWIILPIWFVSKLLSNKNKGKNSTYSRTYRKTGDDFFNSGSTNRTTYGGTFNGREEAEEFFRTFFGGNFGQGTTGTGGRTYGGYSSQNGSSGYQRTTNTYTPDKSRYYTILGVSRGASQDEIRKAYHKLAKEHHPDRFVNSSDSEKKYHENKMKEINDAYENLTK